MISPSEQLPSAQSSSGIILADAHVHLHQCFDIEQVLDAARHNFHEVARQRHSGDDFIGVLFLTEIQTEQRFRSLYQAAGENPANSQYGDWEIHRTEEVCSLLAQHTDGATLIILAGRQIITQEKLEVLALVTDQLFEDGKTLPSTLADISAAGGISVLPWGVGKWLGHRGKLVAQMLESEACPSSHLGDNSGRPLFWPRPSHFKRAEQKGLRILPGTDPFPLLTESDRPGRFGFSIEEVLDVSRPGAAIKNLLGDPRYSVHPYGKLENPIQFFRRQLILKFKSVGTTPHE